MDRYRIEVGNLHGVKPGNIVGAIANEADISSDYIGRIAIFDEYSTVDLPYGMPRDILNLLQSVRVNGRQLKTRKETSPSSPKGKSASHSKPGNARTQRGRKNTRKAMRQSSAR